jgi:hypothetical protein
MLAYAGFKVAAGIYDTICRGRDVSEYVQVGSRDVYVKAAFPTKNVGNAWRLPFRWNHQLLQPWVEQPSSQWLIKMSQITLAEAESIDIRLSAAQTAFRHRATKELKFLPWRNATATDSRRDSIRASRSSISHIKDNVRILWKILDVESLNRKRSALSNLRIPQLLIHRLPLPVRCSDQVIGQGRDYNRSKSRHRTGMYIEPINRPTNPIWSEYDHAQNQDYGQYLCGSCHRLLDLCSIGAALVFMGLGLGGLGQVYEDIPRHLQPLLGLILLLFGFWLLVASIGTLFRFATPSESLLLRPIVRTRFQFVVLTLEAVEVNDLLSGLSCFGHSASPSETIRVALVCWLATAEAPASQVASASSYRCPENVGILAIVLAELKLIQIERQIFFADVMVGADNPALQQRPKALNRICVNQAANVLAFTMPDHLVRIALPALQILVAGMLVGRDQFNFLADGFSYEAAHRRHISVLDHLADHVTLAADRANDRNLVASAANVVPLVRVAIFVLSADVGFVHFDDPHQLLESIVFHSGPQTMANVPRGMQRRALAEEHAPDLARRNALQALQHRVENLEPRHERHVRILKHGADQNRKPIGRIAALLADPMEGLGLERPNLFIAATRAFDGIRPASIRKVLTARRFIGEGRHELLESHHA